MTAGTAKQVLAAAGGQVGYNGGGTCDAPVTAFGVWAGVQTQWCAIFVSWCLAAADVPRLGRFTYGEDFCPAWVDSFRRAGRWSDATALCRPGDVVFYSWNRDGVADHVGLIEYVYADGTIGTIEGNTDDPTVPRYACGNCCRRKHRDRRYVLGYGRPPYGTPPAPTPAPAPTKDGFDMATLADLKATVAGTPVKLDAATQLAIRIAVARGSSLYLQFTDAGSSKSAIYRFVDPGQLLWIPGAEWRELAARYGGPPYVVPTTTHSIWWRLPVVPGTTDPRKVG